MAYPDKLNNWDDFTSWIPVILMLIVFWPVGLILLFRKLSSPRSAGLHGRRARRHPYDLQQEAADGATPAGPASSGRDRQRTKDLSSGQSLTILGAILASVFGVGAFSSLAAGLASGGSLLSSIASFFPSLGFCLAGLVTMFYGSARSRKARRFHRYLALIGKRESIAVSKLATAMPVSVSTAQNDLQEMLDKGYIPKGYLDYAAGMLLLTDEGLPDDPPAPEPAPAGMEREDAVLREIREVNDAIHNPELSRKVDRIGEITGRIFACLREKPDRESQLRSFLSYYLPTTLKILRAYAQMESQGIEGENITAAKARIEGMMDRVVEGFEKQLDRLFQDEALDITSDVAVLEQMLGKDGLSQNNGFQIGG